jgi:hypothetical protein
LKRIAKGGFEIADWKENPAGPKAGAKVTRASVKQRYTGDMKGTGTIEYVMVYRPDKTADYTGVEVITGSVGGRKGSIALTLRGAYDGKEAVTKWSIVPGAGKGDLKDLTGKGEFSAPMGSKGKYTPTYESAE